MESHFDMASIEDFESAGYKRFALRTFTKNADFGLQKLFRDDDGKRYYITIYVYDRTLYPGYPWQESTPSPFGFMPTAQFVIGQAFFGVEMSGEFSVEECESWFDKLWVTFGRPYYERYDHG